MSSSRPLHILTLVTLFPNAAQPNFGIFVERQTRALSGRDGFDVTVVNPVGIPIFPLNRLDRYGALRALPGRENWRGLHVHRPRFTLIPRFGGNANPRRIAEAVLPLLRDIHADKPIDLIDAEFFYPDGPAAMRLADALGVPFTIKARGADIHHWGAQAGCREQILAAADKAAGLFAVSQALKDDMTGLGIDGRKIMVHYTGLDREKFRPGDKAALKAELGFDGPLFITTGALIPRKNQHLVIEALAELPDASLLLAGTGEKEADYRALAHSLGVENRVQFLGSVPHDELPKYLAAADISILVSNSEGLANAWVEALACGTPIIISEAGGARELVSSDVAGRIVGKSSAEIVTAARDVLAEPPSPQDVAATVDAFSWERNGELLARQFREICDA